MLYMIKDAVGWPFLVRARLQARRFLHETRQTRIVQHTRLMEFITKNSNSDFARDHHFHEIRTLKDYQKRVPLRGYDEHEPYIKRVREGNVGALFAPDTKILMFAMTSGTTAEPKTIPVTKESLNNYRMGWTIWGIQTFDAHPKITEKGMRNILQLVGNWRETTTQSGVPCGAITGLTAAMQNPLVRQTYCMPPSTMGIKSIEAKYYVALRLSVGRDVALVIAANPSTLLGIARMGDREKETLIKDIHDGTLSNRWDIPDDVRRSLRSATFFKAKHTAKQLENIVNRTGRLLPRDYWPNLSLLGNWTGGTMGMYLKSYPEYFGDVAVRDIGLIASEGRFTIPIEDGTPGGVLDIRRHFFEFIPEDQAESPQPDIVEASDLIEGRHYFIIPTTAGGLYRYKINDLVRCVGKYNEAPILEFLNKGAHYSSLTGEKLSEFQVVAAVEQSLKALNLHVKSFLLLPTWGDVPRYTLLIEHDDLSDASQIPGLEAEVDRRLSDLNIEYENKRSTQRLGPVHVRRIVSGSWSDFQKKRLAKSRGVLEQYKQPCLLPDLDAIRQFQFHDPD